VKVRFWGTRGSIATPGPDTNHFGGNTSCVEVTTDNGAHLILDCGTGARKLAGNLMSRGEKPISVNILIGHTHWDHIQGFPFFGPLFVPGNSVAIHGPEGGHGSLHKVLAGQMEFPAHRRRVIRTSLALDSGSQGSLRTHRRGG
jgi:phosphoribosyl 1,2-cyclic phosphodiesterase